MPFVVTFVETLVVNWALLFLVTVTSVALSLVSQSPFALLLAVLLVLVLLFPAVLFLVGFGSVLPLLCAFSVDQEDAQEQNQEPKGDYKEEAHVKATHTVLDTRLFVCLVVCEGGREENTQCLLAVVSAVPDKRWIEAAKFSCFYCFPLLLLTNSCTGFLCLIFLLFLLRATLACKRCKHPRCFTFPLQHPATTTTLSNSNSNNNTQQQQPKLLVLASCSCSCSSFLLTTFLFGAPEAANARMQTRRTGSKRGECAITAHKLMLVLAVLAVLVVLAVAGDLAHDVAVLEADSAGAMHLNSSDPATQPVLFNGVDVLGVIREQQRMLSTQQELIANQSRYISSLQEDMCKLHPPHLATIPVLPNIDYEWAGGVLAPNGLIYAVPHNAFAVLIINPTTNTADWTTIANLPAEDFKWHGGVLAPNNNVIYCIPSDYDAVLKIDPATNTADWTTIQTSPSPVSQFRGGVLADNGLIYGIPHSATTVLVIDPRTDTVDGTTFASLRNDQGKWWGGALVPDGRIFCVPYSADSVLVIDPVSETLDLTSITGLGSKPYKWNGGVLASNGLVYGIPYASETVLIMDPAANTTDTSTISVAGAEGKNFWIGGVVSVGGKVVGIPYTSDVVLIVDPETNTADITTLSGAGTSANKYREGVLAPSGAIFAIPDSLSRALVIHLGC